MADETRGRVLRSLLRKDQCVTEIAAILGLEQPTVSHHLAILRQAGLVVPRREGKRTFYAVSPEVRPVDGEESCLELGCCRISFRPLPEE